MAGKKSYDLWKHDKSKLNQNAQTTVKDTIKTMFENDKMKITEYISNPGTDMCGPEKHSHPAHLTIAITDLIGVATGEDGKSEDFKIPAGSTVWFEAGTHVVINKAKKPARLYIIEPKN
jgi:quercetin dioxygenase-like cupin family protein